jgi:hypothetical protein
MVSCAKLGVGFFLFYMSVMGMQFYLLFYPASYREGGNSTSSQVFRPALDFDGGGRVDVCVVVRASQGKKKIDWAQREEAGHSVTLFDVAGHNAVQSVTENAIWSADMLFGPEKDLNLTQLYAHVQVVHAGTKQVLGTEVVPLTKYYKVKKRASGRNLMGESGVVSDALEETEGGGLGGSDGEAAVEEGGQGGANNSNDTISTVNHLLSEIKVQLVSETNLYQSQHFPSDVRHRYRIDRGRSEYFPILFVDTVWVMNDAYIALNSSVSELNVTVQYDAVTLGWFRLSQQMLLSFDMLSKWDSMLAAAGGDPKDARLENPTDVEAMNDMAESIKHMFMKTNPVLLSVMVVVSTLHLLFDMLAFKNEISFWHSKKNFKGLSANSQLISLGVQVVIFLYLVDNGASNLILFSNASGMVIQVWKVLKMFRATAVRFNRFYIPVGLQSRAGVELDEDEKETNSIDQVALCYLGMAAVPLVVGVAIYTLMYGTHKSWYSWILSSCATAVYVGGFILMTPQLFINYKLKSVAHLPWRVFVYKALNTFIDDIFAFIIPMPGLHRLAVFRDDIVFVVYCYQRWIYPSRPSRYSEQQQQQQQVEGGEGSEKIKAE